MDVFLFNQNLLNAEVTSRINFSSVGYVRILLRATDTISTQSYARTGYSVYWYSHGAYSLQKNGVELASIGGWEGPLPTVGTDHVVVFKTVNTTDGGVHIVFSVDGIELFNYIDTDNPILTAGSYGMFNETDAYYVVKGLEEDLYGKYEVDELVNFNTVAGASLSNNHDVTVPSVGGANGAGLFAGNYKNIEVSQVVRFSQVGAVSFIIRSPNTISTQTYARNGYRVYWYSHGAYSLQKIKWKLRLLEAGEVQLLN